MLKIYVVSGLLLISYVVFNAGIGTWLAWHSERTVGLEEFSAAIFTYPAALALGTLAILLGLLQPHVGISMRTKLGSAASYVVGTLGLVLGYYLSLHEKGYWDAHPNAVLSVGLGLLILSIVVNLVGALRYRPAAPSDGGK